jgi:hypothetical protein
MDSKKKGFEHCERLYIFSAASAAPKWSLIRTYFRKLRAARQEKHISLTPVSFRDIGTERENIVSLRRGFLNGGSGEEQSRATDGLGTVQF